MRSLGLVGRAATPFTCLLRLLLLRCCAAVWGGDEGHALAQPVPCGRPRPTVPQWSREGDEARGLYRGRCVHSVPLLFCGAVEGRWGPGGQERDRLHLRRTTEQHVPEVEVQVKRRRTASLSNQECQLYPRRSQQQQVPVVDFQAELRQAFLAETPRGG